MCYACADCSRGHVLSRTHGCAQIMRLPTCSHDGCMHIEFRMHTVGMPRPNRQLGK